MIEMELTIINKLGLHARAASKLVSVCHGYQSRIEIGHGGRYIDAKSIMALLLSAISCGTRVSVRVDGEDESEALAAVRRLIDERFEEAE